jgi:predicted secreted protein
MLVLTLISQPNPQVSDDPVVVNVQAPQYQLDQLTLANYLTKVNTLRNQLWYLEWHPL